MEARDFSRASVHKETKQIVSIMESVGFEAGANWSNSPDSPHYQVKGISATKKSFSKSNTNKFITKMIQRQLQKAGFYSDYAVDGDWGKGTTNAINQWRKSNGWSATGTIGAKALEILLSY